MITAIIQARLGSTRLPNKVFAEIEGHPLLWHVVNRISHSKFLNNIVIATTVNKKDDLIEKWAKSKKILCFRGSEDNVLERYYKAALKYKSDIIVRITSDDPLKDFTIMDKVIEEFITNEADVATNNNPPSFPEGLDIEVFTFHALEEAYKNATSKFDKEHVTQYFYKNPNKFKLINFSNKEDLSYFRWTIDEENDLKMTQEIYKGLYKKNKPIFLLNDILSFIDSNPCIAEINSTVKRSTMYLKNK